MTDDGIFLNNLVGAFVTAVYNDDLVRFFVSVLDQGAQTLCKQFGAVIGANQNG